MKEQFFNRHTPFSYIGTDGVANAGFRHYNPNEILLGKRMEDHLRFAVCYWHNFVWPGNDPFVAQPLSDHGSPKNGPAARWMPQSTRPILPLEMFHLLGAPFFCFHDADMRPEVRILLKTQQIFRDDRLLCPENGANRNTAAVGTANLFSHRRYMAGASTNPDPDIFAFAAATVKTCLDATKQLGGANYVLWGGREGYETLLNTAIDHELDQMGRFMTMVVDYKYKIGFEGTILIEPKPQEPTKHQYDFDVSTVYGFLKRYGLEEEIKVNIEQGHAILAGHSFEHELAVANALGIFGSIDMNRNDYQSGWDTDQFPNNAPEVALAYYHILAGGGFTTGGTNFDAKLRRQSIDPDDLLLAHVGGMDICARGIKAAAAMLEDGSLQENLMARYAGWEGEFGGAIMDGGHDLESLAAKVLDEHINPQPVSGKQGGSGKYR